MNSTRLENGNKVSVEYSIETAHGVIVADNESDIAMAIIEAYGQAEEPRLGEINITKLRGDYPSIKVGVSFDSWCGSIKENAIFYIDETHRDINPREGGYDAFNTNELEPSDEAKRDLNQFLVRFGIEEEPGTCIWCSIF